MQRQSLMPREQPAGRGKDQPHDDADMQARDGENMGQPGRDEILPLRRGDGLLIAGEQVTAMPPVSRGKVARMVLAILVAQVLQPSAMAVLRCRLR